MRLEGTEWRCLSLGTVSGHLQSLITAQHTHRPLLLQLLVYCPFTVPWPRPSSVEIKDTANGPTTNRNTYYPQSLWVPHHLRTLAVWRYWLLCACDFCHKSFSYDFLESLVEEDSRHWTYSGILYLQRGHWLLYAFPALASATERNRLAVDVWMANVPLRLKYLKPWSQLVALLDEIPGKGWLNGGSTSRVDGLW